MLSVGQNFLKYFAKPLACTGQTGVEMSYRTARCGSGKETQLAESAHRKVSAGGSGMLTEQIVESGSRDSKGCR